MVLFYLPDTDVFMILIHLTANGHLSGHSTLTLISGQRRKKTHIDIVEPVCEVGPNKAKGLLGFLLRCRLGWEMDRTNKFSMDKCSFSS